MAWTAEEINRISKLILTASDQLYGSVWEGLRLAPINNLGTGALQPYETPEGFFVDRVINDTTTGFRFASYVNSTTHELLLIPNGTDGWTMQDWASNGLYTGWNQWENNAEDVLRVLRDAIAADPTAKIYIGGQSLGGALAQFITMRLLEERQKPTISVINKDTGETTEEPNPLYNLDLDRVALGTFTAPGVGDVLQAKYPGFNLNSPEMQQMLIRHYTTQGELVNMVGGGMVGGNEQMYYLPGNGTNDIGYLHRIPLGPWDGVRAILSDFAALSAAPRATLSTSNLQSIGTAIALIGADGQMNVTESATRLGLALVIGSALSPPGEMAGLIESAASRYIGPDAGAALGIGVEFLSKALLLVNPAGWVRLVMAGLGIANLAHLGADNITADALASQGFIPPGTGSIRLTPITTYTPDGNQVTVVIDKSMEGKTYQIRLPDGSFWRTNVTSTGENSTSPDGFALIWSANKPYAQISYNGKELGIAYPDQLTTLADGREIIIEARTPLLQDFKVRYVPPAPGQNEVGVFFEGKAALLDADFQSIAFNTTNGGLERFSTWQQGVSVLDYITGGDRYILSLAEDGPEDELIDRSRLLLRRVKTDATGLIYENETKSIVRNDDGQLIVETNASSFNIVNTTEGPQEQLVYRLQELYFEKVETNGDLHRYEEHRVIDKGGILSTRIITEQRGSNVVQTIQAWIGTDTVHLKYTSSMGETLQLAEVISINGIAPSDPAAALRDIQMLGIDADQFELIADDGVSVAESSGLGDVLIRYQQESPFKALMNGITDYGPSVIDALSLIRAIQTGEPLPVVASGLRLANDISPGFELSAASNAASGILSLMSLDAALEQDDTLGAITAGANALHFGAQAMSDFAASQAFAAIDAGGMDLAAEALALESQAFANTVGKALPFLNLANSIARGDKIGAGVALLNIINPAMFSPLGIAYTVFSLVKGLFGGDQIPDPWGTGRFIWDGTGIGYQSSGETGGDQAVDNVMQSVLSTMNALIEQQREQNPGSQLGVIPNRMPSIGYDMSGYRYADIDPLNGEEQHPALRFDTSGNPYNAEPGTPESYQSIVEGMVYSALERQAIAPLWEVRTAKMQSDAGDPKAGLTEAERAGRDGQLAAPVTGETQTFRPVVLDLDGDGIETVTRADSAVSFDVDDSGYLKQTGWLNGDDAFLTLDRDYNGETNSGKEMFSNATVALGRRGLAGMAWVDANYDGKITSADPVWDELKIWQDADQDAVQDIGESQGLDTLGITELNYAMGTFTQNGIKKQLASPDLEADKEGTRISVVPEGILMQTSENGHLSLLVTRIDDKTAVEANRDGITGYEDTEIIVSAADLLANDTLGGFPGHELTITGLTNFRHGRGFIDVNGLVHFTPEIDYAGSDAGFDYIARAQNGQEGTATVDITLQNVNDAPTLDQVDHTTQAVYGYTPVQYIPSTDSEVSVGIYAGGGKPIYEPYGIQKDWDGNETLVYDPAPGLWNMEYHTTPIAYEDTGAGRVSGADVDDPASSLTYEIVNQPQYGGVSLNADGTFQYTSWKEPGIASDYIVIDGQYASTKGGTLYTEDNLPSYAVYPTTDVFQVRITDPQGASTIQSISVPHYGPYLPPTPSGGGGKKPIAVDLNGNGFEFVNVDDSNIFFDINGDGWKERTAWVDAEDGLLAYDIDGDGKIDSVDEISFTRYQEGAQTDLEGLAAFDTNGDGRFDANDEQWDRFGVWQDRNQNGVTDEGEFKSLSDMGVYSIILGSDGQFRVVNGQTIQGVGAMEMEDGSQLAIADVTLAYSNETQIPQADGSTTLSISPPFSPDGEELNGTPDKDLILGKSGNNIVNGYAGDDVIFEDGGNDIIDGGDGNDLIYAGADNDLVMGGNGDDAIYAGLGNDVVFGGDGHDAIFAEGGNDVVFGGAGNDLIAGGWGNDVLSGDDGNDQIYGETGNDALFGRAGSDELLGMAGDDYLNGGAGNDLLDGGSGSDEMIGGAGNDIYVVDDAGDTVFELAGEGNDTVRTNLDGYVLGANVENLTLTGTANLSGVGNELDNLLTGNQGDNRLSGGAGSDFLDGSLGADELIGGAGDDTYIVDNVDDTVIENPNEGVDTVKSSVTYTLSANVEHLMLTGTNAINATGNELDNQLLGNAADNFLDGGVGADFMAGEYGNDTYMVDQTGDLVVELANQGIDTVVSDISYTLGANVENLSLSGTADLSGTGNGLANLLVGNAGDNRLDGAAGADILVGGAGDDVYVVDNAGDSVIEGVDEGIDSVFSSVSYRLSDNVENLILSGTEGIDATGNELDNELTGNAGSNRLDGGAGADVMTGGAGDDIYVVDNPGDTVIEIPDGGIDSVLSSVSFVLPEQVENLTLIGSAAIDGAGNNLDNLLTGNAAANVLDGATGDDRMMGGAGDDIYYVDSAGDAVVEAVDDGYDTVRTTISLTAPENVERIELLGGEGIDATGNAQDNVLVGNGGANRLDGGLGADVMFGGGGNDIYVVDNVGDTVIEMGGEGDDLVLSNISYALSDNVERLTLSGAADITGTGNALDNILIGNSGRNVLDGHAGADAMAGGAGNDDYIVDNVADTMFELAGEGIDTIYSSVSYVLPEHVENLILTGNDNISAGGNELDNRLIGNSGDNVILGGAGDDLLDGAAGNDVLIGGIGNDILIGGEGDDTYHIDVGDGLDWIEDSAGTDTIRFGEALNLDNVALRVTENNDTYTAHLRMLNAGGCEQADQGFDFSVTLDEHGRYVTPIERFEFADGSIETFDDLLIKTRVTWARPWERNITTGRDDDIILASPRSDTIHSGTGHDIIYAGPGSDTVYGEGGDDLLLGSVGNDTLDGGCGIDILAGSLGRDQLRDLGGSNALLGGFHNDVIEAGDGNDFIAGGRHDDTIQAGGGANVIAFNRGDGHDTVLPGMDALNTLSLGGGIEADDLAFRRNGQDLLLETGHHDRITFKDWYADVANQNFVTLQIIEGGSRHHRWYKPEPTRMEGYDFGALVAQFDASPAIHPRRSSWSLMHGLLDAHLATSDSQALGGELAASYAEDGTLAMTPDATRQTLHDPAFGRQAQNVGQRLDTSVQGYSIG